MFVKGLKSIYKSDEKQIFCFPYPSRKLKQKETYCLSQKTKKTRHHVEASEIDSIKQNDSGRRNISVMIIKVIKLPIRRQRLSNWVLKNMLFRRNTRGERR